MKRLSPREQSKLVDELISKLEGWREGDQDRCAALVVLAYEEQSGRPLEDIYAFHEFLVGVGEKIREALVALGDHSATPRQQ